MYEIIQSGSTLCSVRLISFELRMVILKCVFLYETLKKRQWELCCCYRLINSRVRKKNMSKINVVQAKRIKVKVYVTRGETLSHKTTATIYFVNY